MWKIDLKDRDDSLQTLNFHSTFTSLNKTLTYSLSFNGVLEHEVEINFITKKDKDKKDYFIELGELIEKKMTITYYNPGTGTSGLTSPITILENDELYFKSMFHTNFLSNSESYLLTIEFFIQKK